MTSGEKRMDDVETTVLDYVAKKANVERATLSRATEIASLDLQSIDILEIMFDVEEKYNISLLYNVNEGGSSGGGFKTVGDVLALIEKQTGKPA
jgi:acyl carrier protein